MKQILFTVAAMIAMGPVTGFCLVRAATAAADGRMRDAWLWGAAVPLFWGLGVLTFAGELLVLQGAQR